MSIYGNYLNESSNMMNINNIDLYDYIHQECTNMKSMIESGNLSIEEQVALLEAFDLKAFLKNIVVKFKEVVKTLLAKIKQISTQFATSKFANVWKEDIDDDKLYSACLTTSIIKVIVEEKNIDNSFSIAVPTSVSLSPQLMYDRYKESLDKDGEKKVQEMSIEKVMFDKKSINIDYKKTYTTEEFKSKNPGLSSFIKSNTNDIINIIQGKYIYDIEKTLIKFQSNFERYINNSEKDKSIDKNDLVSFSNFCISVMKQFVQTVFLNFKFCMDISLFLIKNRNKKDWNIHDKVIDKYEKDLNK